MICKHCGLTIQADFTFSLMRYVHTDGKSRWLVCDLPRTHPQFMMVSAEPDDNYCAEKEENGTCIHSDHTP